MLYGIIPIHNGLITKKEGILMETQQYFRPTKAIVDLQAIQQNIKNLKDLLQPNVQIIAVVKANAYGHGDIAVAKAALEAGATMPLIMKYHALLQQEFLVFTFNFV
ncbi:Alanine racemase [Lysinibacillus sphaericus]